MVGPISKLEEGPSEEKEETVFPSAAVATELTIKFMLPWEKALPQVEVEFWKTKTTGISGE